jgi:hypothetical protein
MLIRLILPLLFLSACAGDSGTSADGDKDYSWDGGLFQLTSNAVDDSCLDGGFVSLLLPEGDGSTNDWAYPIEIPSWEAMADGVTYEIVLQEPFTGMEVTATQGAAAGQVSVASAGQTDVLFNEDLYDDCLVDMGIDVLMVLDGAANVHGYAELRITEAVGVSCPLFATPCSVDLDFTGLLIND